MGLAFLECQRYSIWSIGTVFVLETVRFFLVSVVKVLTTLACCDECKRRLIRMHCVQSFPRSIRSGFSKESPSFARR